jgi:hypothetical protein
MISENIIIDSEVDYRIFYATTSAMSNVDYDPIEVTALIFNELRSATAIEERLEALAESFKDRGRSPDDIKDGQILSVAVRTLAFSMLEWVRKIGLYNEQGKMTYTFEELLSGKTVRLSRDTCSTKVSIPAGPLKNFFQEWLNEIRSTNDKKLRLIR